ncbi:DUF4252 domain-containing protein [Cochleicola gelatinilyticus]|uniref:DUF4252 domain-containing protein n=1 Tax=Cochleicola gelatinilyticus TaxID=1763537 RepID=A0A167H3I0_9FLAO|nr:DUF4252 domain-containing protein [Cochleicola gelatinilyticus]OAB78178.1 hypothetical protein ULVI_11910 [Cochleicola gelatinilyticus]
MTLIKYFVGISLAILSLWSCSNEKSLQRYLVEKQDDPAFMKVDLATSLLKGDTNLISEEQKELFSSIKKINVVAYPIKDGNTLVYEAEKKELDKILTNEKYQLLSKVKADKINLSFQYVGEETSIDEVIIVANDSEKGFAIFRLLGENMHPDDMMQLYRAISNGDIDLSSLSGMESIFKNNL